MIPQIDVQEVSPSERLSESPQLITGARAFLQQGVLLIKNAFDPIYIKQLQHEYLSKYQTCFREYSPHDARYVGDKRNMVTLQIEGAFNSEALYANRYIMTLMAGLLGQDFIINSLGSVASLPGSPDQHIHRDLPNIYLTDINYSADDTWLSYTSPYAITVGIPLVPINAETGNTRFWPGTHLKKINHNDPGIGKGEDFYCDLGSCVLFDYRIIHGGVANTSGQVRPLLYCVYSRPWFRDHGNFNKDQKPIYMTAAEYKKMPAHLRHLFDWALA